MALRELNSVIHRTYTFPEKAKPVYIVDEHGKRPRPNIELQDNSWRKVPVRTLNDECPLATRVTVNPKKILDIL